MTLGPRLEAAVTAGVVVLVFGGALLLERVRPLRQTVEGKLRRVIRNLTMGGIALAVSTLLQAPLLTPVSRWTMERHLGLSNLIGGPVVLRTAITIVLLDYSLWFWHWACHRVPFLWRFHLVHHVDRDLDSSTALRFHFGEQTLSIAFRAGQIVALGAAPLTVWLWQTILFAAILFHHSNLELPVAWEGRLVRLIVTPRMHGIHHSDYRNEANSNWSSLFSWWDYLHGTALLNVPQRLVTIGVPAHERPEDVTLGRILLLPFVKQRADFDVGGEVHVRPHEAGATLLAS